ncbi:alkaline phosphatase D family protein [Variovorax sp. H27-G14]|uniref:alkaline phosphatase D family protein n=1 Tax=Variovorax sp. H27-G14 TaxID=3111914 RepID=UPI0038FCDD3D
MKIAFASCMNLRPGHAQPVWDRIAAHKPDYLFLLGDQIYMDFFPHLEEPKHWADDYFGQVMAQKYTDQWNVPGFKQLVASMRERQGPEGGVYGTWDDHDFAWNNACGSQVNAAKKNMSRALFAQFMQIDPPVAGLYYSTPLSHAGQRIGRAIFLDTRWYSEEPGDSHTLLGEDQFQFLQQELQDENGFVVICAGMPIRATGNGWMRYRDEYAKFRALIQGRNVIFLSGDIHENAFLPPAGATKMFEVISSGAFVTKYKVVGERENFGILDYTPTVTDIQLFDKHGLEHHNVIDNATFDHQEL